MQKETVQNVFHQTKGLRETGPELRRKGQPKCCFPPGWSQFPLPGPRFCLKHAQNVHLGIGMSTPRNRCAQQPGSPAQKEKRNPTSPAPGIKWVSQRQQTHKIHSIKLQREWPTEQWALLFVLVLAVLLNCHMVM